VRLHAVVVREGADHHEDQHHWQGDVYCLTPERCNGFEECAGDHTGMDPDDEDSPAYDRGDEFEMHGVAHEWHYGYGWTVPYNGCVVQAGWNDSLPDEIHELGEAHGPGLHLVDDDWDEGMVTLTRVTMDDVVKVARQGVPHSTDRPPAGA